MKEGGVEVPEGEEERGEGGGMDFAGRLLGELSSCLRLRGWNFALVE